MSETARTASQCAVPWLSHHRQAGARHRPARSADGLAVTPRL